MRLYITDPSPFARKCRIVLRERGLIGACEERRADPYADDAELVGANPIVQVPTLVTDDGEVFTDSPLICAWLDSQGRAGPRLLPPDGPEHWRVRQLETLADAGLEMGVKWVLEKRRPEAERSPSWIARWRTNLDRVLNALEARHLRPEPLDLGVLSTGVLTTWLGFRHPEFDWKTDRPSLGALSEALEQRSSFRETFPR